MIWGAFCAGVKSKLVFISNKMNYVRYLNFLLDHLDPLLSFFTREFGNINKIMLRSIRQSSLHSTFLMLKSMLWNGNLEVPT